MNGAWKIKKYKNKMDGFVNIETFIPYRTFLIQLNDLINKINDQMTIYLFNKLK